MGVTLAWDPRPETLLGPSVIATRGWGGASSGGVAALLDPETVPSLYDAKGGDGSLGLEMAWVTDLSGWRHGMSGSAYGRVSGRPDVRELRLGWRVAPDMGHDTGLGAHARRKALLGGFVVAQCRHKPEVHAAMVPDIRE